MPDNPMFVYDEAMGEAVFDYCRWRLSLDPVPLDFGGARESFDEVLSGLIGESGNDPAAVLALFADHLATAVVSCDSPRFLAFIPAAPTKAALLFDMIVSCSSLQGTSWLEAAGAVMAGAAMVMVMPPYHGATIRASEPAIFDFCRVLSDAIDIPIMIQDAPVSGTTLTAAFLARMSR